MRDFRSDAYFEIAEHYFSSEEYTLAKKYFAQARASMGDGQSAKRYTDAASFIEACDTMTEAFDNNEAENSTTPLVTKEKTPGISRWCSSREIVPAVDLDEAQAKNIVQVMQSLSVCTQIRTSLTFYSLMTFAAPLIAAKTCNAGTVFVPSLTRK